MNSDSGSGASMTTSRPPLARAVLQGDRLAALLGADGGAAVPPARGSERAPSAIRAAVIGIDGLHLRARELRRRLDSERREFARAIGRFPRMRHVIIVLRVERDAERAATRSLDRAAHLAHLELEMRPGRDICITGIVITDDADAWILIERLNERIRDAPIEGSYVISGRRIRETAISAAAAAEFV